ncbi:diguanylate cyclase [Curvibacter sp. CHRR-16]|uniref:GGDEF domain-containing protein n=1 Tax=Curvibacter sp. CHRR-16 TaxID=2835872 RepID=UPI001BDA9597|nr:diguanylate cyclase [Curvibacter sp. CHRR-16]MBT0569295.1 diguanylate cyclase [Curvibacter sp. CHRR-16]
MSLDPTTLIIINVANVLVIATALPLIMGQGLSTAAARGRRSLIFNAGAWICMLLSSLWSGLSPNLILSTMAMGLLSASQWSLYRALENWLGPRPLRKWLMLLAWIMPAGYALSFTNYQVRVGWSNLLLAGQILIVSRACLYPLNKEFGHTSWRYPMFGCLLVMAVFTTARGVLGAWFTELYPYFLAPSPVNLGALVCANMTLVLGAMSILAAWREEAHQQLHLLTITDPLTGLLNRNGWTQQAHKAIQQAQQRHTSVSVLMLDLDYFKLINDRYGHETGDAALRFFGHAMQQCQRPGDLLARIGGEEFCVLLMDADTSTASSFDKSLREALNSLDTDLLPSVLSFSAGHTLYQGHQDTLEAAMARADSALYRAKAAGRGQLASDYASNPRVHALASL